MSTINVSIPFISPSAAIAELNSLGVKKLKLTKKREGIYYYRHNDIPYVFVRPGITNNSRERAYKIIKMEML